MATDPTDQGATTIVAQGRMIDNFLPIPTQNPRLYTAWRLSKIVPPSQHVNSISHLPSSPDCGAATPWSHWLRAASFKGHSATHNIAIVPKTCAFAKFVGCNNTHHHFCSFGVVLLPNQQQPVQAQ
jgi:hypothetical protein